MSWEDLNFGLMSNHLQSFLKQSYTSMKKYASERPVTENSILEFLEQTRNAEEKETCDRYANIEKAFQHMRKQNPIECYAGQTYNHTKNIESLNDLVNVLAPYGNNTKRSQPGSCVFVMFYTLNCISSRLIWLEYHNAHPFFPNIQWVLVDSLKFYTLNADFGITGLPTIMLFHQGKPIRKYSLARPTAWRIIKFLWQNTNLAPVEDAQLYNENNFFMPPPTKESDPYLTLAWAFILISIMYSTYHTATFNKFWIFMKRMWYESGAGGQHEHNE